MHVYTLVCLKLDQIGFLILKLKHPDYLIDSRITPACIHSSGSDRILHSAQGGDFELEVDGRRRRLSSEITTSKSAIVHLGCVIIMYTIYKYTKM